MSNSVAFKIESSFEKLSIHFMPIHSEINAQEKIAIKSVLISAFREPIPQIAVQIAALIAKIARYDVIQYLP